eukprot:2735813-Pleurochrysis_carterae.AAC.4
MHARTRTHVRVHAKIHVPARVRAVRSLLLVARRRISSFSRLAHGWKAEAAPPRNRALADSWQP